MFAVFPAFNLKYQQLTRTDKHPCCISNNSNRKVLSYSFHLVRSWALQVEKKKRTNRKKNVTLSKKWNLTWSSRLNESCFCLPLMYSSNFKQLIINSNGDGRNTVCIPATKLQCLWGEEEKEAGPLYIFLYILFTFSNCPKTSKEKFPHTHFKRVLWILSSVAIQL